jgi:hypothetical protein
VAASWPGPSSGLEIVLTPVADTTIYRGEGHSENSSNALGDNLSVGQNAEGVTRRALLRFDLSGILPGSIVHSAQLTLFESRSRGNYEVALHRLLANWGEGASNGGSAGASGTATAGDATWLRSRHPDTLWTSQGGDFIATSSATTFVGGQGAPYAWSSASMVVDVQLWIDQSAVNHGWILIGEEVTNQNAKLFGSRQSGTMPELVLQITPVPEPGPYAMMAAGIGMVGWQLRRRQLRQRKGMILGV